MRIPFRSGQKIGGDLIRGLDAQAAKPKPEPAVHYLLGAEDRLACGAALGPVTHSASNPQWTTCGACKRTRIWKHNTKP